MSDDPTPNILQPLVPQPGSLDTGTFKRLAPGQLHEAQLPPGNQPLGEPGWFVDSTNRQVMITAPLGTQLAAYLQYLSASWFQSTVQGMNMRTSGTVYLDREARESIEKHARDSLAQQATAQGKVLKEVALIEWYRVPPALGFAHQIDGPSLDFNDLKRILPGAVVGDADVMVVHAYARALPG